MIKYVPFEAVSEQHLADIAKTLLSVPEDDRPEPDDILRGLMSGSLRLFDWPQGSMVLGVSGTALFIWTFSCRNVLSAARPLAADLKRLAADWGCDKIETTVFNRRLTSVIQRVGGVVKSQTIVLPVG